ncbi:MAG: hypothetical protein IRY94_00740 [Rhodospirillaceae bacterium]|nr:hypothetical protein [Rhodospirillaceae bacterium]
MSLRYDIVALAVAAVTALVLVYRRDRIRLRRGRAAFFDDCLPLLEGCTLSQDDVDFPVLAATYRGRRVRLQPIVDHIAVRKLPSLWLLVTVFEDLPWMATLDLLMRPQNIEFYSPSARLRVALDPPPGWPAHALLRTDDTAGLPPLERLTPHMAMFDDPRMKELVVTPKGVRLVYQADQAERAHYAVLRQARFSVDRLPAETARRLLDEAIGIIATLTAEDGHEPAARPG